MKIHFSLLTFTLLTALFLIDVSCHATIWRVNNNPVYTQGCNHCFSDLQTANDTSVVQPGDTIHLEASAIEYEITTITKPLVIIGTGYFLDENPGLQKNQVSASIKTVNFDIGSEGSALIGVRVYHPTNSGDINIKTSDITIEGCWVERFIDFVAPITYPDINNVVIKRSFIFSINNSNNGVSINDLTIKNCHIYSRFFLNDVNSTTSGSITHCVIANDGSLANRINFSNTITEFYNNIIIHTSGSGSVMQQNNNDSNVHDNIFTSAAGSAMVPAWISGNNNIALDYTTIFSVTGSQDSILNVNSMSVCAECYTGYPSGLAVYGMFGGDEPYQLSGMPEIPSIFELQSPFNIEPGTEINVTFGTKVNNPDSTQSKIVELEYFWDIDAGFNSHADTVFVNPVANMSSAMLFAEVPVSLGSGNHVLFVRSRNTQGFWSHTNFVDSVQVVAVGIEDFEERTDVSVYPNPFVSQIIVESKTTETLRVIVHGMDGKKMIDKVINETGSIDTSNLLSGIYVLSLWNGENIIYRTSIVKSE